MFIGNQKAVSFLERVIANDAVSHAYIFSGPEQVGKRMLAEFFARALITGNAFTTEISADEDNPNAVFRTDLKVIAPVVEEVGGVLKEKDIPIAEIRQIQQFLNAYPYLGRKKVLIIDNAHRMNVSAQNALLKVLEEPNSTSQLILITNEIDRLLPTLRSRSQTVSFGLVAEQEISHFLANRGSSVTIAANDIFLSMGRPGRVLKEDGDLQNLIERKDKLRKLEQLSVLSMTERMQMAESFSKDMPEAISLLRLLIWKMRLENKKEANLELMLKKYQFMDEINKFIETVSSTNANSRLALEKLFLNAQ